MGMLRKGKNNVMPVEGRTWHRENLLCVNYTQSGSGQLAKEYYQKALERFPDSEMAKSALNMIASLGTMRALGIGISGRSRA